MMTPGRALDPDHHLHARRATGTRPSGAWGAMAGLASAAGVLPRRRALGRSRAGAGCSSSTCPSACWSLAGDVPPGPGRAAPARLTAASTSLGAVLATARDAAAGLRDRRGARRRLGHRRARIARAGRRRRVLAAFAVNELRRRNPLFPFSILRIKGLAAADATQLIALAGFYSMFFFITLYMQNVLGFSPIEAGAAYLPVDVRRRRSPPASVSQLVRPHRHAADHRRRRAARRGRHLLALPDPRRRLVRHRPAARPLVIMSLGLGAVVRRRHHRRQRRRPRRQGRARRRADQHLDLQLGAALGLAIFSAIATSRTSDLLAAGRLRSPRRSPPASSAPSLACGDLPARRRRHRPARDQHPRRTCDKGRAGSHPRGRLSHLSVEGALA